MLSNCCHNCRQGRGPHCSTCQRVEQDDIRIRHTPHNRSELQAARPAPSSPAATALPAEVENRLRIFLCDLFDLEPVQLLLLQHVRNGGTPSTFARSLARTIKDTNKYGVRERRAEWDRTVDEIGPLVGRATAKAIWDGMVEKNPLLAIFQTWDKGHGGRQSEEPETDEPRQIQAEFDF